MAHPDSKYTPPRFAAPPNAGYLHTAVSVAPPGRVPFVRRSAVRERWLAELGGRAAEIIRLPGVVQLSVFRAILVPPASHGLRAPFDVAALIETRSHSDLDAVRGSAAVERMLDTVAQAAAETHVMSARCARFLGPVDHSRQGVFLFNHFVGADVVEAIRVWEYLAAWYAAETGLANSTLLAPTGPSAFVLVNHARWEIGPPRLALVQLTTRTFRGFVQANLREHHLRALSVLYRLVWPPPPPTSRRPQS